MQPSCTADAVEDIGGFALGARGQTFPADSSRGESVAPVTEVAGGSGGAVEAVLGALNALTADESQARVADLASVGSSSAGQTCCIAYSAGEGGWVKVQAGCACCTFCHIVTVTG